MPKCKSHYENLKIEITLWHGSSPVNLLRIFRTTFPGNTSGCLFLYGVQEKPKEFFYTGNLKQKKSNITLKKKHMDADKLTTTT